MLALSFYKYLVTDHGQQFSNQSGPHFKQHWLTLSAGQPRPLLDCSISQKMCPSILPKSMSCLSHPLVLIHCFGIITNNFTSRYVSTSRKFHSKCGVAFTFSLLQVNHFPPNTPHRHGFWALHLVIFWLPWWSVPLKRILVFIYKLDTLIDIGFSFWLNEKTLTDGINGLRF